jgi:hypothetical protein
VAPQECNAEILTAQGLAKRRLEAKQMNSIANASDLPPYPQYKLDYTKIITGLCTSAAAINFTIDNLAYACRDSYVSNSERPTSIVRITSGPFEYVYDNYSYLEATGAIAYDAVIEDRLVVAYGRSAPGPKGRDDYRLKGWVGPTERTYGSRYDKGHFIANSIGGAVDRCEVNVFVQRRDLNRGWSAEGKNVPSNGEILCAASPHICGSVARSIVIRHQNKAIHRPANLPQRHANQATHAQYAAHARTFFPQRFVSIENKGSRIQPPKLKVASWSLVTRSRFARNSQTRFSRVGKL